MSESIIDPTFGSMEYNYGWCKEEEITFFDKTITVEILAEADIGQPISEGQQDQYVHFSNEVDALSATALKELKDYYAENLPSIELQTDHPAEIPDEGSLTDLDLINMVTPKTVFFQQDGIYAVLCNCLWEPQYGLAIIISDQGITIGTQDEVI
ncbi:MAG: hypothetical protein V3V05_02435 [Pontiella sp.]